VSLLAGCPMYIVVDELTGIGQRLRIAVFDVLNRVVASHPPAHLRIETEIVSKKLFLLFGVFGMLDGGESPKAE